jgi:predicted enzyme related to lactoylglutathione lyase
MQIAEVAFIGYPVTDAERARKFYEVVDFDAAISELKAKQIPFDLEPTETPVCWMAVIADPDGNKLTVHKRHG